MGYLYYPGCSLEGTAREYDLSCRELFRAMGVCLTDIPDWTCCGATAAQYVDQFLSVVLPARNLALAEKTETGLDVLVPCSACYLNLKKSPGRDLRESCPAESDQPSSGKGRPGRSCILADPAPAGCVEQGRSRGPCGTPG